MLSIFLLITFIFIIILLLNSIGKNRKHQPNIIKNNNIINSRGVFACKKYKKNDMIELAPTLIFSKIYLKTFYNELYSYVFNKDNVSCFLGLGHCSLYNHSDNNNALQGIMPDNSILVYAIKDIEKDEEILISYGMNYWNNKEKIDI